MEGTSETLASMGEVDADDEAMVCRLTDTIVTKKKFKDFVASLQ